MKRVVVILAGGRGTRLWPLSDENHPKPLLEIFSKKTMLEDTVLRAKLFADTVYVLTDPDKKESIQRALTELNLQDSILVEPEHTGTEAAVAFAVAEIERRHGKNTAIALLPVDHRVRNIGAFYRDIRYAATAASENGKVMLFGIVPSFPATGYGYIRLGKEIHKQKYGQQFSVDTFLEKPDSATAREFLKSTDYVWNSGIYIGTIDAFTTIFKIEPALYTWYQALTTKNIHTSLPEELRGKQLEQGVIEHTHDLRVITATFDWTDIGTYDAIYRSALQTDEQNNAIQGRTLLESCRNCLIVANRKKIIALGLKNIAIIDGPDGILVCDKTIYSQLVGQIATGKGQPKHDA